MNVQPNLGRVNLVPNGERVRRGYGSRREQVLALALRPLITVGCASNSGEFASRRSRDRRGSSTAAG